MLPIDLLALSMRADSTQMAEIAHNLANVNTAGYKRRIHNGFQAQLDQSNEIAPQTIDLAQGALKKTGNPFDVALKGPGFLSVDTDQGTLYTRKGSFSVSTNGDLVLQTGEKLQAESGSIHLDQGDVTIKLDGSIVQNDQVVGKLKITEFSDPSQLQYLGNNLFKQGNALPETAQKTHLQQGHLEMANVNTLQEMQTLITTVRHYEAMGQVYRSYDSVMNSSINQLAEF